MCNVFTAGLSSQVKLPSTAPVVRVLSASSCSAFYLGSRVALAFVAIPTYSLITVF
jgi:hypothetical protein